MSLISLMPDDLETLLFCSFRYALGRSTYIVQDVVNLLSDYSDCLFEQTKIKMKAEIYKAINEGNAGMQMDVDLWAKLAEEWR